VGEVTVKRFDEPDEVVSLPNMAGQVVVLNETYIGRYVAQPGWRWSKDVKPLAGTPSCQYHHQGIVLSGCMEVVTDDGARRTVRAGEAFDLPPGHDAWVVGDEPCISVEFRGVRGWGRSTSVGERVVATLLVTDIVGSTAIATRLGDGAWNCSHGTPTGCGSNWTASGATSSKRPAMDSSSSLTVPRGPCAARPVSAGPHARTTLRCGREFTRGRWSATPTTSAAWPFTPPSGSRPSPGRAKSSQSASTVALVEGSGLSFADAGEHELKGLAGVRRVYRLTGDAVPSGGAFA
jgi:hypothetical protein